MYLDDNSTIAFVTGMSRSKKAKRTIFVIQIKTFDMLQKGDKAPDFEGIDENGTITDIITKVNTKAHTAQLLK